MTTNFSEVLKSFVERIERIEVAIGERKADRKEIYGEARTAGIDVKALRKIIVERRQDKAEREMLHETLDQYRHALGMLQGTPLGKAAVERHVDEFQRYTDESGLTVVVKGATPPL